MNKITFILTISVLISVGSCNQHHDVKPPNWYFIDISWGTYWNSQVKHARIISDTDSLTTLTKFRSDSLISIKKYPLDRILKDSIFLLTYSNSQAFDLLDTSEVSRISDSGDNIKVKIVANDKTVENSYAFSNVLRVNSNMRNLFMIIKSVTGDTTIVN